MSSLSARLLLWVSVLLIAFFGLTVFALDLAFQSVGERAMRDRLDIHLFALLAAAEPEEFGQLYMPGDLPEARFANPGSGLYGHIQDQKGVRIWRSKSSVGSDISYDAKLNPGGRRYLLRGLEDGSEIMSLSMGVEWEFDNGQVTPYVFSVAESMDPYYAQVSKFRKQLLGWFASLIVLLLLALALLLRRVLKPLRRIETEISEVEAGVRPELGEGYPKELRGVTRNTNTLLRSERGRRERYRQILDNLAHSLKTPLAVMQNLLEDRPQSGPGADELRLQISRMDEIVRYQLQKASAAGSSGLGAEPVPVPDVVQQIVHTLDKVYAGKEMRCLQAVDNDALFFGDRGDLMELLGNLLDNAYKWCRQQVRLSVSTLKSEHSKRQGLEISVDEDGPGIDEHDVDEVLNRGTRTDERVEGQGIGLAVVKEIVSLYRGQLAIARSAMGGASIRVTIPPE